MSGPDLSEDWLMADTVESSEDPEMREVEDDEGSNNEGDYGDPGEEHEFEIIDQVDSEEDGGTERQVNGIGRKQLDDNYSSSSEDLDDSELHAMLEKGIDKDSIKKIDENDDGRPIIKHKIVLNELESDPFDILPEGWVWVTHNCGMPVYLHKETRVCTMARPYSLGSASARTHDIPISAIPCLQYRKQLDKLTVTTEGPETGAKREESVVVCEEPAQSYVPSSDGKSPAKVWVVAEESSSFKKISAPGSLDALHTGIETGIKLKPDESVCLSPTGQNIAVSLDTSCFDQSSSPTDTVITSMQVSDGVSPPGHANKSACPYSHDALTNQQTWLKPRVGLDSSDATVDMTDLSHSAEASKPSGLEAVADTMLGGEANHVSRLVREESASNGGGEANHVSRLVSEESASNVGGEANHVSRLVSEESASNVGGEANHVSKLVSEESASNAEPSELVTSGSNSLATIKRKIDSLRKKHGGKQRKLDTASGWPTDNNIAVTAVENENSYTASQNTTANEKLKAHAAEVKIKSAEERAKESLLDSTTIHSYCQKLFQFKTLEVKKYRSWKERRKHLSERSKRSRPELPPSTKLITCPIPSNLKVDGGGENVKKKEFILNPTGKSYLCILHEYMQRTLKIQPVYAFKELENSKTPYGATVKINNIEYGTGYASSKKVAKQEAAKETLKVLIPDLFKKITDQEIKRNISDLSFFDEVKVTDPRVNELGNKVGQPSPYQLLLECLRRNFGMGKTNCDVSTKPLKNQKCEFTINVGKHSATVVAKNKREGKQLAAQAILAKLHPHVPSWGSLLRLYGTSVEKPVQKPEEVNDVKSHAPNHSVLESLRDEMKKLHRQKEAIQSKGKMIISSKDLPSKMSGVDL
ncbi:microprocessor complex subunit DGCR8-like [Physella acuta]|uniref:microprocessor complex subunit DGCR8-like n=1 Tax=Physella acuta TaxID=109671 RepID=UPI0027DE5872|nr:microprocessor complex subunit DGCR8-like [Physella acuta]XP_059168025.1 microprocessor complex subunit DGCR8-like [Physella acuta]